MGVECVGVEIDFAALGVGMLAYVGVVSRGIEDFLKGLLAKPLARLGRGSGSLFFDLFCVLCTDVG